MLYDAPGTTISCGWNALTFFETKHGVFNMILTH